MLHVVQMMARQKVNINNNCNRKNKSFELYCILLDTWGNLQGITTKKQVHEDEMICKQKNNAEREKGRVEY